GVQTCALPIYPGGPVGRDLYALVQPGVELQLSHGLGICEPGPGVLLDVEPLDFAGGCLTVWNHVAAVPQSGTCPPGRALPVCVAGGVLCAHHPVPLGAFAT